MKKALSSLLPTLLLALLPGLLCLSLLTWYADIQPDWLFSVSILLLWCALLTGADRLLRNFGPVILCVPAVACVLLFADRGAMADAVTAFGAFMPILPSASVTALALLISGVFCAVMLPLLRSLPLRCAFSLLGAAGWIAAAWLSLEPPRLALCALLPILLSALAELLIRRRAEGDAAPDALLVLFSAVSALLLLLPSSREPYPYPLINYVLERIETAYQQAQTELFYRREGDAEYALDFNGLSDTTAEGDGAAKPEEASILLSAGTRSAGVFYLSGSTWDSFDGTQWRSTVDRGMVDFLGWNMDTAERLYALWRRNREAETPFYPGENQLLFRYNKVNTRTIFTAPDTFFVSTSVSRFPFTTRPSRVLFNYVQERDAWYRLFLLRPGALTPEELAASSQGYEYDGNDRLLWGEMLEDFNDTYGLSLERSERVESQLAQRESYIRSSYLPLPPDTDERVFELARSVTAGCETDLERLAAIEDYFHEGFRYTLSPALPPEGVGMLEHLLFDAREGYCTWYATAAAMLARAVGIPTRYVQGYRAELHPNEVVELSALSGHAWCEAYISGYGWVVVEATPGFSAKPSEAIDWEAVGSAETGLTLQGGTQEEPEEPQELIAPEPEEHTVSLRWLPVAGCALIAAAAVFLLLRRRRAKQRYNTAPYSERARIDLQRLSVYLAWRGYPKERAESLRDWFGRVRWHYLLIDADEAMGFAVLYEELLFGGRKLTLEQWLEEKTFVDALRPRRRLLK